jgi:hypothetical protein
MGRSIEKSGDTVARSLLDEGKTLAELKSIAVRMLGKRRKLQLIFDNSMLRKMFSEKVEGTWKHYDGILGTTVNGYQVFVAMIAFGNLRFPWEYKATMPEGLCPELHESTLEIIQRIYADICKYFAGIEVTVLADGLFSTSKMIEWCKTASVRAEMRMHKSRVVMYAGKMIRISEIKKLIPKNVRRARTIEAIWQGQHVFITAEKRVDKHLNETIVYLISTYRAKPSVHAENYKKRWPIEKCFRTAKGKLGFQDCASTRFSKQCNHLASVFLAYALVELERHASKLDSADQAIHQLRQMNFNALWHRLTALNRIY